MPKRIPCRVVQTKLLCPVGDWFVARPWDEPCHSMPPVLTNPLRIQGPIGNVDKLFADFARPAFLRGLAVGGAEGGQRILDYYA